MTYELPNNKLKARLQADLMSFGIYVGIPSPTVVEVAALAGFDFVRLDWAHAPLDLQLIENVVRAAEIHGITPIARLEQDHQKIASILEMGMMGIIVPGITTAEAAREVAAAAKFAPIGQRGMFSASRRSGYGATDAKAFREWTKGQRRRSDWRFQRSPFGAHRLANSGPASLPYYGGTREWPIGR